MKLITSAFVSLALATPALAGSLATPPAEPMIAPPPPAAYAPARDWTGGYVGGQLGLGDLGGDVRGSGGIGGLYGGYTHDFGTFALGAELGYDRASIGFLNGGAKLKDATRVKVRGGPTFGDVFAYGAIGAVRASADVGGNTLRDNGWMAGVGMEYAIDRNWSVGGEVMYHRINDFGGTGLRVSPTTAQARVSFRF